MGKTILHTLWAAFYILCACLGFIQERSEGLQVLLTCLSLLFFLPPAVLLYQAGRKKDRKELTLLRNLSAASLGLTLLGLVLAGLEMNAEKTMCWARLTDDMLSRAHALREDNEGIVNYLLEIRGVQFACLAEERGSNQTKFSLRSRGKLDVATDVAVPLGGGGHAAAAGATVPGGIAGAKRAILDVLRRKGIL